MALLTPPVGCIIILNGYTGALCGGQAAGWEQIVATRPHMPAALPPLYTAA